jgi:hypothetical protein
VSLTLGYPQTYFKLLILTDYAYPNKLIIAYDFFSNAGICDIDGHKWPNCINVGELYFLSNFILMTPLMFCFKGYRVQIPKDELKMNMVDVLLTTQERI